MCLLLRRLSWLCIFNIISITFAIYCCSLFNIIQFRFYFLPLKLMTHELNLLFKVCYVKSSQAFCRIWTCELTGLNTCTYIRWFSCYCRTPGFKVLIKWWDNPIFSTKQQRWPHASACWKDYIWSRSQAAMWTQYTCCTCKTNRFRVILVPLDQTYYRSWCNLTVRKQWL